MRRILISAALVAPLALAGCGTSTQADYTAVNAFASGLTASKVTVAGPGAAKDYKSVLTALGVKPSVSVGPIDGSAATLHWIWALPGGTWSYDTSVPLVDKGNGVWAPSWSLSDVIPGMTAGDKLTVTHPRGAIGRIVTSDGQPAPGGSLTGVLGGIEHDQDTKLNGEPGTKIELTHAGQTAELVSYAPTNGSDQIGRAHV